MFLHKNKSVHHKKISCDLNFKQRPGGSSSAKHSTGCICMDNCLFLTVIKIFTFYGSFFHIMFSKPYWHEFVISYCCSFMWVIEINTYISILEVYLTVLNHIEMQFRRGKQDIMKYPRFRSAKQIIIFPMLFDVHLIFHETFISVNIA